MRRALILALPALASLALLACIPEASSDFPSAEGAETLLVYARSTATHDPLAVRVLDAPFADPLAWNVDDDTELLAVFYREKKDVLQLDGALEPTKAKEGRHLFSPAEAIFTAHAQDRALSKWTPAGEDVLEDARLMPDFDLSRWAGDHGCIDERGQLIFNCPTVQVESPRRMRPECAAGWERIDDPPLDPCVPMRVLTAGCPTQGTVDFYGDGAGCVPIGSPCPTADAWPEYPPEEEPAFYVDDDAIGPGGGTRADPFPTIGEALLLAPINSTIAVGRGEYTESLQITKDGVHLRGACAADTLLHGPTNATDVIEIFGAAVELSDLSIDNGVELAIAVGGARTKIHDLQVGTGAGEGINVGAGSAELDHVFVHGRGTFGIVQGHGTQLTVSRTVIEGSGRPAFDNFQGALEVRDTRTAGSQGISARDGSVRVERSLIEDATSAGILVSHGTIALEDVIVSGVRATGTESGYGIAAVADGPVSLSRVYVEGALSSAVAINGEEGSAASATLEHVTARVRGLSPDPARIRNALSFRVVDSVSLKDVSVDAGPSSIITLYQTHHARVDRVVGRTTASTDDAYGLYLQGGTSTVSHVELYGSYVDALFIGDATTASVSDFFASGTGGGARLDANETGSSCSWLERVHVEGAGAHGVEINGGAAAAVRDLRVHANAASNGACLSLRNSAQVSIRRFELDGAHLFDTGIELPVAHNGGTTSACAYLEPMFVLEEGLIERNETGARVFREDLTAFDVLKLLRYEDNGVAIETVGP